MTGLLFISVIGVAAPENLNHFTRMKVIQGILELPGSTFREGDLGLGRRGVLEGCCVLHRFIRDGTTSHMFMGHVVYFSQSLGFKYFTLLAKHSLLMIWLIS